MYHHTNIRRKTTHLAEKTTGIVHEHTFKALFLRIYNKKLDLMKTLNRNELGLFEDIVRGYPIATLKDWTEYIVVKESTGKQEQIQRSKTSEEDTFFLRHFLSANVENGFKESEIKTLEKTILKSIHSDAPDIVNKQIQYIKEAVPTVLNENMIKYRFLFKLQKGSVFLNNAPHRTLHAESLILKEEGKTSGKNNAEGASYTLTFEGTEAEVNWGTEKIGLTYKLETFNFVGKIKGVDYNIANVNEKKRDDPFLLFYMDQPVRRNSAPITINLGIGSIHFIYYPFVIYEFQSLFSLSDFEEKGKNVAIRELKNIGEKSRTKVEEYMHSPPR